MDWTENPLVALYFAFSNSNDGSDRTIWVFVTSNGDFVDSRDNTQNPFDQMGTKVFIPNQITQRITVQAGWFTLHRYFKNKFTPLNKNAKYYQRGVSLYCQIHKEKKSLEDWIDWELMNIQFIRIWMD
ncbi:hypothetical protein HME9304_01825 [Flagellimonas maritima]|uniref:FRG domain-containing protein n=1 Tax=Flagellimonas maritima TaxID=1383885 RepID=A0A2Z4LT09_9FLAO|nr:hypothetical protein HME9304_01825 [Allomuricauda aurantiaca]